MTSQSDKSRKSIFLKYWETIKSRLSDKKTVPMESTEAGIEVKTVEPCREDEDSDIDYLYELRNARKHDKNVLVKWFTNNYFDLAVWFDLAGKNILGFQLCYDKHHNSHALTWKEPVGYLHNKIDDGDNPGRYKMTPLLVPDGIFNKDRIIAKFKLESANIDSTIRDFTLDKIEKCDI